MKADRSAHVSADRALQDKFPKPAIKLPRNPLLERPEFALFDELLNARLAAKLTQVAVAERMQTRVPAISRLESAGGRRLHSPSIATLRKYAQAVGCRLVVKLEPLPEQAPRVA